MRVRGNQITETSYLKRERFINRAAHFSDCRQQVEYLAAVADITTRDQAIQSMSRQNL